MLPFTTYSFPETPVNKTPGKDKWLIFISGSAPSPAQSDLMGNIRSALKDFSEETTYSFIYDQNQAFTLKDILHASTRLVISFGKLPSELGLWIDLANPGIRFLESFTFILTLSLADLEKNGNAKKELWKHMQRFMEMQGG
jgi:hypothetical protein